jgi:predicted ATPase/DNA-binding SARP family transcriptional activator
MWTIQLLGGLAAHSPQREVTHFRTQKSASLLAYLAMHATKESQPRPREALIEMLWPEAESNAGRHNLSNALSFLRHTLEPPGMPPGTVILADRATVRLNPAAVTVDAVEFERSLHKAAADGISEAERQTLLSAALERYQGALLPGFYEEWIPPEALRLEGLFVQAVVRLVPLLLGAKKPEQALTYAQRAAGADPLSQEAAHCLMLAWMACGQPEQALRAYRQLERRLEEELNANPSPALRRLFEQAGTGEPTRAVLAVSESVSPREEELPFTPASRTKAAPEEPGLDRAVVQPVSPVRLLGGEFLLRTTTRFFGREEEIDRLGRMLSSPHTRLVTLIGPGGTGKTRLALEVAAHLVERTAETAQGDAPTGAVFVPLASVIEAERLFEVILRSLGIVPAADQEPLDQLASALEAHPNTLLVLDNFEQLAAEGAMRVHDLLGKSAGVKILVTSRQRLHIAGEREFHLAPLPTSTGAHTLEALLAVPSVALFVDRAQTTRPDFHLTERNFQVVSQLCDYLEGLPLAIELAAARVSILSPIRIQEQVQADRLDFLATRRRDAQSRHRTLRATLDWSYQLLPDQAREFLAALSVFRGGWTLEAAEAVCAWSEAETLELAAQLRDSSLIQVTDANDGLRFTLLETIREYSQEKLQELGEDAAVRRRHRDYFTAYAEQAEPELMGPNQAMWLDRLETEHANLCAAIAWCESDETSAEAGLRLVGAIAHFWEVRGYLSLGREYLTKALARKEAVAPTPERAKALRGAGALALAQGDYASARPLLEESLTILQASGDRQGIAASLYRLGQIARVQGDNEAARLFFEESRTLYQELGDRSGISETLYAQGGLAQYRGDFGIAKSLYEESLAIRREAGDRRSISTTLNSLGMIAHIQGDHNTARSLVQEALVIREELIDKRGIATSLSNLGMIAYNQSDPETVRQFFEKSLALFQELGDRGGMAHALYLLGYHSMTQRDFETARTLLAQSIALYQELGNHFVTYVLGALGHTEREVGEYARATALYQESLRGRQKEGDKRLIACSLEDMASIFGRQGQMERAARLLGAAEALCETLGRTPPAADVTEYERTREAARAVLTAEAFATAWEQGRAMTLEQAVVYALEEEAANVQKTDA